VGKNAFATSKQTLKNNANTKAAAATCLLVAPNKTPPPHKEKKQYCQLKAQANKNFKGKIKRVYWFSAK
jgi:hypothetical protein